MFNLLPTKFKEELFHEYSIRILVATLFLVIIFLILFAGCFFGLFIFSKERAESLTAESAHYEHQFEASEYDRISKDLELFNQEIVYFDGQRNPIFLSDLFKYIYSFGKNGLEIKSVSFSGLQAPKNQKMASTTENSPLKIAEISVSGTSFSRELLQSFVKYLEKNSFVKRVELPISSFAKKDDLNFSLRIISEF